MLNIRGQNVCQGAIVVYVLNQTLKQKFKLSFLKILLLYVNLIILKIFYRLKIIFCLLVIHVLFQPTLYSKRVISSVVSY